MTGPLLSSRSRKETSLDCDWFASQKLRAFTPVRFGGSRAGEDGARRDYKIRRVTMRGKQWEDSGEHVWRKMGEVEREGERVVREGNEGGFVENKTLEWHMKEREREEIERKRERSGIDRMWEWKWVSEKESERKSEKLLNVRVYEVCSIAIEIHF